ncbi:hypothetical protein NIES4074_52700 [Cylindrospermum sp. NIES-4074]|nr:hypothetical protein NIES4074_52700 [Cylindrospermum sp. NIES-4074]
MQLLNSFFTQNSTPVSLDVDDISQESPAILTLEELVEILEQLANYLETV